MPAVTTLMSCNAVYKKRSRLLAPPVVAGLDRFFATCDRGITVVIEQMRRDLKGNDHPRVGVV
jgi:hypothetical protein